MISLFTLHFFICLWWWWWSPRRCRSSSITTSGFLSSSSSCGVVANLWDVYILQLSSTTKISHFTFYVVRPFEESHILHFTLSDSLKDFTFYIVTLAQPVQSNIFCVGHLCPPFLRLRKILQNKFSSRRWKCLIGQFFHLLSNSPSPCLDLTPGKNI